MTAMNEPTPAADLIPLLAALAPSDRSALDPQQQRAEYLEFVKMFREETPTFAGTVVDESLTLDSDGHSVGIRRYLPTDEDAAGHVLVYLHGGGWVMGNLETHDHFTRSLSEALRVEVVAVDYRLAPEHPFPAAFDDCLGVLAKLVQTSTWVGVGGDSAGGNLAAAVTAELTRLGSPVDAQFLIYPGLSAPKTPLDTTLDGFGLDASDITYFWNAYRGSTEPDARLAPLLAADPIDAPPTLVVTAGLDPLAPDGIQYAQRLIESGVATTYLPFPNLIHGWLELAGSVPSAGLARAVLIEAIRSLRDRTITRIRT